MVFGEIIEPSSRAILYDEEEIDKTENLQWETSYSVPESIETLLISDSKFTNSVIMKYLLNDQVECIAKLHKQVATIYRFSPSQYIILCNCSMETSIGELTLLILPWIKCSQAVFTLTTDSISNFKDQSSMGEENLCILRHLSTQTTNLGQQLESPNLVTGLSANILSYSVHRNLKSTLYIGYLDTLPVDSLNSKKFVELLNQLGFTGSGNCKLINKLPENNLYT